MWGHLCGLRSGTGADCPSTVTADSDWWVGRWPPTHRREEVGAEPDLTDCGSFSRSTEGQPNSKTDGQRVCVDLCPEQTMQVAFERVPRSSVSRALGRGRSEQDGPVTKDRL